MHARYADAIPIVSYTYLVGWSSECYVMLMCMRMTEVSTPATGGFLVLVKEDPAPLPPSPKFPVEPSPLGASPPRRYLRVLIEEL